MKASSCLSLDGMRTRRGSPDEVTLEWLFTSGSQRELSRLRKQHPENTVESRCFEDSAYSFQHEIDSV